MKKIDMLDETYIFIPLKEISLALCFAFLV